MKSNVYDKFYRRVSQDQKERLRKFRSTHPYKYLTVDGVAWKYISCGRGKEALLLLTGGTGIGEDFFPHIMALENEYRIVSPFYPPVTTMEQLVDGVVGILESEDIHQVNILGLSFGGWLGQVIVHKYPDKVSKLILSHTTTTSPPVDQAIFIERQKRLKYILKIFSFLPFWMYRLVGRWRISKMISIMNTEEKEFWKAYYHEMLSYSTKEEQLSYLKSMIDFGQNYTFSRDDLANWSGKVLILESDNDTMFHPSERDAVKELYPQAQVHTFQGAGHMAYIVNLEEFIFVVRNFLREE